MVLQLDCCIAVRPFLAHFVILCGAQNFTLLGAQRTFGPIAFTTRLSSKLQVRPSNLANGARQLTFNQ
jgi:hypothetical protein